MHAFHPQTLSILAISRSHLTASQPSRGPPMHVVSLQAVCSASIAPAARHPVFSTPSRRAVTGGQLHPRTHACTHTAYSLSFDRTVDQGRHLVQLFHPVHSVRELSPSTHSFAAQTDRPIIQNCLKIYLLLADSELIGPRGPRERVRESQVQEYSVSRSINQSCRERIASQVRRNSDVRH